MVRLIFKSFEGPFVGWQGLIVAPIQSGQTQTGFRPFGMSLCQLQQRVFVVVVIVGMCMRVVGGGWVQGRGLQSHESVGCRSSLRGWVVRHGRGRWFETGFVVPTRWDDMRTPQLNQIFDRRIGMFERLQESQFLLMSLSQQILILTHLMWIDNLFPRLLRPHAFKLGPRLFVIFVGINALDEQSCRGGGGEAGSDRAGGRPDVVDVGGASERVGGWGRDQREGRDFGRRRRRDDQQASSREEGVAARKHRV